MPLKITLKPHEKIVIGTAVITNGDRKSDFIINNDTTLLREKDVMKEDEANTPAKRIYYVTQVMYMRGGFDKSKEIHKIFHQFVGDFMNACPNPHVAAIISDLGLYVLENDMFKALKECKKLMDYEEKVLGHVLSSLSESAESNRVPEGS